MDAQEREVVETLMEIVAVLADHSPYVSSLAVVNAAALCIVDLSTDADGARGAFISALDDAIEIAKERKNGR